MILMRRLAASLCLTFSLMTAASADNPPPGSPVDKSHSAMGAAFNEGPRRFATKMTALGNAQMTVTTKSADAQAFFNQGLNLLHSYWWFEAERAFRQAAYFDKDCAMAYWGMAYAAPERGAEFIKVALKKADRVTDRERRFIEALAVKYKPKDVTNLPQGTYVDLMRELVSKHPDDVEAKAFLVEALRNSGGKREEIDKLILEILSKNPMHPGAHHYRIHIYDGPQGDKALDNCRAYPQAAPNIGHAQHMPGHIYSQLGMWADAAFAMDAATRIERRYVRDEFWLPVHTWNYTHNQHYLVTILGYAGRPREAIALSRELIDNPPDPKYGSPAGQGRLAMLRPLVRYELWDEALNTDFDWGDSVSDRGWKHYISALAHIGKGHLWEGRQNVEALEALFNKAQQSRDSNGAERNVLEVASLEARGQLQIADSDVDGGLAALRKAADLDRQRFLSGDPGAYPNVVGEAYGSACLRARKWSEAEATFRATLQKKPNSGISLCGLIESCLMQGKTADAAEAREKLQKVWKFADPDLPHLQRMKALGTSIQLASAEERAEVYRQLDRYGPARWEPVPAPSFALKDRDGRIVRLSDYKGKNLIVIFYLGGTCQHCIQQLNSFAKDKDAFDALDTEIVAISADTPTDNQRVLCEGKPYPFPLLSDPQLTARHAYKTFDDFENLELHGTYFIDKTSRVRWFTTGSTPFTDLNFLKREVERANRVQQK